LRIIKYIEAECGVCHAPTVAPRFLEPSTVSLGSSAFGSRDCIKAFFNSKALVRIDAAGLCWLQRLLLTRSKLQQVDITLRPSAASLVL
jgi:hypothetical protein